MYEKLIVQVICDKEIGTAFYVAPDLLLTAWHTVESFKKDGNNVVKAVGGDLKFVVDKIYKNADVAVLKVQGKTSKEYLPLLSHHIRIGENCITFGYPDTAKLKGLRVNGNIKQKVLDSTADYNLLTDDTGDSFNYSGMSGAPVFQGDNVVGVVIEQIGNSLNLVSVQKLNDIQEDGYLPIETEQGVTTIPASIARDVEASQPNFEVIQALDERLTERSSKWVLLYGSPGCGKTTLTAYFESEYENLEILGRFFFKVPNDTRSRAERCSQGFFVNWLETIYANRTGAELVKSSFEDKRNGIAGWLRVISRVLLNEGKQGVIFIDGLDELSTENGNRVDDILSLIPDTLPDNISIVLSCITKEILPASVIGRIAADDYIEVTPLNMAACESFIQENSGEWPKPYTFIQAVAVKTEGHPLYMNYLCRYISETFNETTKECELNDWLISLPTISGDIRSYYEAVWKKADPKGVVFEVLALLSQTRGPVKEEHLIGMMKNPNPFEFKSFTKEFLHLLKEKDSDVYEIYHSSFRLFITGNLSTIISYTNDQIAAYCDAHKEQIYSIENHLHHVVNGSNVRKGLAMCNQNWADQCAINDVSPDLIMHDIKECLSLAVDNNLPIEVVRLMLLAQRIEMRCDSIMVDNAKVVADIKILMGKPAVALKYLVRDNSLLVNIDTAISYLRCLFELGYDDEAYTLLCAIEATIRKEINENIGKKSIPYVLVLKGQLIVEGILAGYEDPAHLPSYLNFLNRLIEGKDEEAIKMKSMIREMILAYHISNELRSGKKIDIGQHLKEYEIDWNEVFLMFFIKVIALYDYTDTGLHAIGQNEAYNDCLRQVEEAMLSHTFKFCEDELKVLPSWLIDKKIRMDIVQKILKDYGPNPGSFVFRKDNGVDVDADSLNHFYQESLYLAYLNEELTCPALNRNYHSDISWARYIEALVARTAYVNGVLYRKRAVGEDYQGMYAAVKEIIDYMDFSFEQRVRWKRSYLLPEELIPFVYDKLAEIYKEFFVDKLNDFMAHLQNRMSDQLSLYREGYCAILIRLTVIFAPSEQTRRIALYLADEAVKYIEYAVQNRSERCGYLLQICREYALMGENDKATVVYHEVIRSSMGPEWYKEAQLEFINRFKSLDVAFDKKQIAHLAAIFEEASGEMTFQRYIRQQKNTFVATIAKTSSLKDAIAYYKFETLPAADRIVKNAEEWKVDMPKVGEGYELGCNHLIEASAICQLLEECKEVSPYIRYSISELFWDNWDKMHNDYQYAELHSDIFTVLGENKVQEVLLPRMAEYFIDEYNHDGKGDYLNELERLQIPTAILDELEGKLEELGYKWERASKNRKNYVIEEERIDKLSDLPTCQAVLEKCRKDIVSPLGSYWYSLSEIISPLIRKTDLSFNELFEVVTGHYDINVRPSAEQFEKFNWFVGKLEETDKDEQMIHLLIWFVLHPDRTISSRAFESICWLVKYDERVIDCLIDEVVSPSEIGLATQASAVLLEMAKDNPDRVLAHTKMKDNETQLLHIPLFSVSRNLYEMAKIFAEECGYADLLNELKSVIPESLPDRGDVWIDFEDKMFVEHKIDKLNNLNVTGKDFATQYLDEVHAMTKNGSIKMLIRSDVYVQRSFYLDYSPKGRYSRIMENLFDRILYSKVDNARASHVYYAINDF